MNDPTSPDQHRRWSEDLLKLVSLTDTAIILHGPIGDDDDGARPNAAADLLAQRLRPDTANSNESTLAILSRQVPDGAWDIACRDGRWSGEVAIETPAVVLEIRLFADIGGHGQRFATFGDVTTRSAREAELQRRHDELESTYRRLAGTQEQLLQSEKMASIGQLAAGVAHEINNPVGYIHSNLGTLQEYVGAMLALLDRYDTALNDSDPGASRESLQQMRERLDIDFITGDVPKLLEESREGIERVTKIVQDLKDFSRVGRDEPMQAADIEKGLESTLNIVWNDLKYKVRIEKYYSPLPAVECHVSEINQVLMNLLINAGQAIHERGVIVMATGADDGEVWVSISDSGCGIPDDVLQRIFDPFYTTKPIGRGTGLGLAVCYSIVTKHHGRIEVSSRLGVGSTFRVVLPISQPPALPAPTGVAFAPR